MTDLVVWVPDKNIEATLDALLQRPQSLGIRKLDVKIYTDMHRDPGCFKNGAEHLAGNASFKRCQDPSFLRFREILGNWFPRQGIS